MDTTTTAVLNEDQQKAHDTLVAYIMGQDKTYAMWVLEGYAGTGKSFTLAHIVATVRNKDTNGGDLWGKRIAMTAPTHKAVRVMKKFARGFPGVGFATVHSLLGLKEQIDSNGKIKFVQDKDPTKIKIEGYDVLFLDETSMLADELFALLLPYVRRGLKLIFVGDPVQIPPVNHKDAKPLIEAERAKHNIGIIKLEKIVRQALDNPILTYATRIRKSYQSDVDFSAATHVLDTTPQAGIVSIKESDEERLSGVLEQYFNCEEFRQDADFMKVIAWRNNTVDTFNRMIRRLIYKEPNLPLIMVGEKLIVDAPIIMPSSQRILLANNEEIVVDRFQIQETEIDYLTMNLINREWVPDNPSVSLKYYNTFVKYFDEDGFEQEANIRILHETEKTKLQAILNEIKKAATAVDYSSPFRGKLWQSFYAVDRKFAAVKYNYAVTSHKSQGSTYGNCMIVDWDIAANRRAGATEERNRIRYVAATRARHLLFIVK